MEYEKLIELFAALLKERRVRNRDQTKITGISKASFSYIRNGKTNLSKKTIVKMLHWIEKNEPHPMVTMDKKKEFCCSKCLQILPMSESYRVGKIKAPNMHYDWVCKACRKVVNRESKRKRWRQERLRQQRYRDKLNLDPLRKRNVLELKSKNYYKRNYGEWAEPARLVFQVRREIKCQSLISMRPICKKSSGTFSTKLKTEK